MTLDEDVPYFLFVDVDAFLLVVGDLLVQITVIRILHDDTEGVGLVLPEGFLVADDTWVANRGEYSNLVEGVLLLLVVEVQELHSLQSVLVAVGEALDLVDDAIGTLSELAEYLKVLNH
jgi:hypothetical protein